VKNLIGTILFSVGFIASGCISKRAEDFNVTTMDGFPDQIEAGCACYFSESKIDFENNQFIYENDYGNHEFISINGELVVIDPSDEIDDKFKVEWEAESEEKFGYEVTRFTGTLTVTSEDGTSVSKRFIGDCGC